MSRQSPLPPGSPLPGARPPAPRYLPPPPYPPSQPALPARQRPPRHSPVIAPLIALLGMVLIAGGSFGAYALLGQQQPAPVAGAVGEPDLAEASAAPFSSDEPEFFEPTPDPALPTLAPDVAVAPLDERPDIKGTIVFSRDGDIWSASGKTLKKVTGLSSDFSPTWSDDGKYIYFVRINKKTTSNSRPGGLYTFFVPEITRIDADGSNKVRIYNAFIPGPGGQWFSHVLQPDISPDGKTLAVVSDGPNGSGDGVELHLLSSKPNSRLQKVAAPSSGDLGHNDPEWSPNGRSIAYTYNQNKGTAGVPRVVIHTCKSKKDCRTGKSRRFNAGTASPSWSPDGTWLAVEITNGLGRDIEIVNAQRGDPRVVLTDDRDSFAPVVSPNGDQIAYLHRDGLDIDLRVMTLDFNEDGKITLIDDKAVTVDGAIDAESPPAWFIPKSQLTRRDDTATEPEASSPPN